ncbi:hypothetical protein B0F90DRAFT_1825268 [Multifurca ochricompacta]|uniref:Uncharacterized protein n=1 Tax=Multifurca ochricompacta TaxID=376703 RepID=A0AAD4QEE3_9AGAM|nr:hypothetical protein B0F90DRAFT_1825268 [Multifurca ochricompacta]
MAHIKRPVRLTQERKLYRFTPRMSTSRFRHPLTGRAPSPIDDPEVFESTRLVALDAATKGALRRPSDAPTLPPSAAVSPCPSPPRPPTPFTMTDNPATNLTQAITLTAANHSLEDDICDRVLLLLEEARAQLQTSDPPPDNPNYIYRPTTPPLVQLPADDIVTQTQREVNEPGPDYDSPGFPFQHNHPHSPRFIPQQIIDKDGRLDTARWVAFEYHCVDPCIYFTMGKRHPISHAPLYATTFYHFAHGPNPLLSACQQHLFDDNQSYTPLVDAALDDMHDPGAWAEVSHFHHATYCLDEAHRNIAHWRQQADQASQSICKATHAMSRTNLYYRIFPHLTYIHAPSCSIPPTQAARFVLDPELRTVLQAGGPGSRHLPHRRQACHSPPRIADRLQTDKPTV